MAQFDHSHTLFDSVLKKHVVPSKYSSSVSYKKLKEDRVSLDTYTKALQEVSDAQFQKFSKPEQLAFLLNAYNAFTLQLVIDHYPVSSIKKIGGLFSSPWKKEFFTLFGEERNLDYIEHGVIRKRYDEPRIHFAVNCASIGCPGLLNEAFIASSLEAQLNRTTKMFLSDPSRNYYDAKKKKLYLSKIFSWFAQDFKKGDSTIPAFVAPYMIDNLELQKEIASASSSFLDYDWNLNE